MRTYYVLIVGDKVLSMICSRGGICGPGVAHVKGFSPPTTVLPLETTPPYRRRGTSSPGSTPSQLP